MSVLEFEKLMFNKLLKMNRITNVEGLFVSQNSTKPHVMRSLRLWWRKHGAKVLFFLLIGSIPISNVLVGSAEVLMLTVPCGIKKVNTCGWLWFCRQLYFLSLGIFTMLM